jgi:hypothetical protein
MADEWLDARRRQPLEHGPRTTDHGRPNTWVCPRPTDAAYVISHGRWCSVLFPPAATAPSRPFACSQTDAACSTGSLLPSLSDKAGN